MDAKTLIETDDNGGQSYHVYHHQYKAGKVVALGASPPGQLMYLVAVLPVNKMERATDLKPVVSYKADKGVVSGSTVLTEDAGKKILVFNQAGKGTISWDITPGVADIYTLRVKYANTTGKEYKADLKILAADGTVMKSGELIFGETPKGKWRTVETTTGTSINAGNYKVIVTAINAEGLNISGLEVQ